jgi:DNA-binding FadR family transcriptional regulator
MAESLSLRTRRGDRTLGATIARALEREIVAQRFPIGHVLGSEANLIARLGVSRSALREAVRVLELHGVATMRRGPGGGLVVTAPESGPAVRASALMLEYMRATPQHVFEARSALELKCVELAAKRIDEHGIAALRDTLAAEHSDQAKGALGTHELHTALAEATGNPALVLFVEVLTALSRTESARSSSPTVAAEVREAHDKVAEAVIAGDSALARHRMQVHLAAVGRWLAQGRGTGTATPGFSPVAVAAPER